MFLKFYPLPAFEHFAEDLVVYLLQEEKPREKEKGRTRNIDHFMEELKYEQEMREKRNQERDLWREGRHSDSSAVWCICYLLI